MTDTPGQSLQKRSFVPQKLIGYSVDKTVLPNMGLIDLSLVMRMGVKGLGASAWLTSRGISLDEHCNRAVRQQSEDIAVRLAPEEILILGDLKGESDLCPRLAASWKVNTDGERRGYLVPRSDSHCWFLITGVFAPEMFAKICAVDLSRHKFSDLQVAQTLAAHLSVIIVRDDQFGFAAYHLLADSASAEYLWACLLDAMKEFQGQPRGLGALLV